MAAPRQTSFLAEYPPADVLIAVSSASLFLLVCAIALKASAAGRAADGTGAGPASVPVASAPVKVIPVLDLDAPLLKLGGKPDATKLPDRWIKKGQKARVEKRAQVSTAAEKTVAAIPPPDLPVAQKASPPAPPDAEETKKVDVPVVKAAEVTPPSNVPVVGHQDGARDGTETDPLKARAVDLYRARIVAWFSGRFRVTGSGLSPEELVKHRVSATVEIGPDRAVTGFSISASGSGVFDAAARAALEGAKGHALPPPPDNYPDIVQSKIHLTFVCKEHRCD